MLRVPEHRYKSVQAGNAFDKLSAELAKVIARQPDADPDVQYAYDLFAEDSHRAALDAFTMAQSPLEIVSQVLEVPVHIIKLYQHFFMDMAVFRNRLERTSYAHNYPGDEKTVALMESAVTAGTDYLRWLYNSPNPQLSPRTIMRGAMMDTFYRSMAHRGNHIASATAQEALKWLKTAVKNSSVLEENEPSTNLAAVEQLRIALSKDDSVMTKATPESVDPKSVMH